jgi:hypothetical protein
VRRSPAALDSVDADADHLARGPVDDRCPERAAGAVENVLMGEVDGVTQAGLVVGAQMADFLDLDQPGGISDSRPLEPVPTAVHTETARQPQSDGREHGTPPLSVKASLAAPMRASVVAGILVRGTTERRSPYSHPMLHPRDERPTLP